MKALVEREKEKKKNRPSDIRAEAAHSSIREGLKALVEREKKREKSSGDDSDIPTEAVCSSIREGLKALVEKERKKKKAKRFPLGSVYYPILLVIHTVYINSFVGYRVQILFAMARGHSASAPRVLLRLKL